LARGGKIEREKATERRTKGSQGASKKEKKGSENAEKLAAALMAFPRSVTDLGRGR
jgi:hypothetical protein